jgi:hypothetical protein
MESITEANGVHNGGEWRLMESNETDLNKRITLTTATPPLECSGTSLLIMKSATETTTMAKSRLLKLLGE